MSVRKEFKLGKCAHVCPILSPLQTALGRRDLGRGDGGPSNLHGLSPGQLVHGVQPNVEVGGGDINRCDEDAIRFSLSIRICEIPAGAAVRGVPACDSGCTTDAREGRQGAEGGEAASEKAVATVRACYCVQGLASVVVCGVVGHTNGADQGWDEGKRGKNGGELHRWMFKTLS